jgi:hypothetical protein
MTAVTDQAQNLRKGTVIPDTVVGPSLPAVAITGGKGGVGKTCIAVNLALMLARLGRKPLLVDCDLSLANADVLLGLNPTTTLYDVLTGVAPLAGAIVEGLSVTFLPAVITWLSKATLWAPVAAFFHVEGVTLGTLMQAGIVAGVTVGLAALLIAALTLVAKEVVKNAPIFHPGPDNPFTQALSGSHGTNNPGGMFGVPHAAGGWVGLNGPELSWVGEKGPEYIVPNDKLGAGDAPGGGVRIMGVSAAELVDMVERGLYFKLQLASPTLDR